MALYPGLYFPGLPGKDSLPDVADDAEHIAAAIVARADLRAGSASD